MDCNKEPYKAVVEINGWPYLIRETIIIIINFIHFLPPLTFPFASLLGFHVVAALLTSSNLCLLYSLLGPYHLSLSWISKSIRSASHQSLIQCHSWKVTLSTATICFNSKSAIPQQGNCIDGKVVGMPKDFFKKVFVGHSLSMERFLCRMSVCSSNYNSNNLELFYSFWKC